MSFKLTLGMPPFKAAPVRYRVPAMFCVMNTVL